MIEVVVLIMMMIATHSQTLNRIGCNKYKRVYYRRVDWNCFPASNNKVPPFPHSTILNWWWRSGIHGISSLLLWKLLPWWLAHALQHCHLDLKSSTLSPSSCPGSYNGDNLTVTSRRTGKWLHQRRQWVVNRIQTNEIHLLQGFPTSVPPHFFGTSILELGNQCVYAPKLWHHLETYPISLRKNDLLVWFARSVLTG